MASAKAGVERDRHGRCDPEPDGAVETAGSLEPEFERLVEEWHRETDQLSDPGAIFLHPAYQRIIGMGLPAVPLILEELQRAPDQWFWALEAITEANPVPPEAAGKVRSMAQAWINWGKQRGFIP